MLISSSRIEGALSFKNDEPSSSCHHAAGSSRQKEWLDGWVTEQSKARRDKNRIEALLLPAASFAADRIRVEVSFERPLAADPVSLKVGDLLARIRQSERSPAR